MDEDDMYVEAHTREKEEDRRDVGREQALPTNDATFESRHDGRKHLEKELKAKILSIDYLPVVGGMVNMYA